MKQPIRDLPLFEFAAEDRRPCVAVLSRRPIGAPVCRSEGLDEDEFDEDDFDDDFDDDFEEEDDDGYDHSLEDENDGPDKDLDDFGADEKE